MNKNQQKKAVLIDRDGTINVEIHYLHEPEKFKFIPKTPEALKQLKLNGFALIVITNQGAIGRGMYGHKAVKATNNHMETLLKAQGVELDAIYYCPHTSEQNCNCRKPKPGMILEAVKNHNINISISWMIGDKLSDIAAGNRAGVRTILVKTGYGINEEKKIQSPSFKDDPDFTPDYIAENLWAASQIILNNPSQ